MTSKKKFAVIKEEQDRYKAEQEKENRINERIMNTFLVLLVAMILIYLLTQYLNTWDIFK